MLLRRHVGVAALRLYGTAPAQGRVDGRAAAVVRGQHHPADHPGGGRPARLLPLPRAQSAGDPTCMDARPLSS